MAQQFIALLIITWFLWQLLLQKRKRQISNNELILWLVFWLLAGAFIIFIKQLDQLFLNLGFSGSGIEVLLYLGIAVLFYFIFKLRLRLAKLDQNLTKIVEHLALEKKIENRK